MADKTFQRHVADQMEMKALDENIKDKTFVFFKDEQISYKDFYQRSSTFSHLFQKMRKVHGGEKVFAAVFMDNNPAFIYSYGGCALSGGILFGLNTGLRGQVLLDLINNSKCQTLIVDDRHFDRIADIMDGFEVLTKENIYLLTTDEDFTPPEGIKNIDDAIAQIKNEMGDLALDRPDAEITMTDPLMVIYTSGTTGLPKGITNSQGKLMNLGMATGVALQLKPHDRGYVCMPLFHSNAMFLGVMSAFNWNASTVIAEKFSARGFTKDILKYGVTYWNYVGQPVHYVILALEKQYGSTQEIVKNVAENENNKLRVAYGNGASSVDQDKFIEYFGLTDMMEGYGTTEMAIATMRHIGDPRGSVGMILDSKVKIYNDNDQECPAAEYDENEKFLNYTEAVGEIVRETGPLPAFEGYHNNPDATSSKVRDGVYHSGDLGHIRVMNRKRFLYFDGRTDDWIRKDGENFSAESVARVIAYFPPVELAVAYGVPCSVSDEWVMTAIQLKEDTKFDPDEFFKYMDTQASSGEMDKKWMPEFVRVVKDFEYTRTQKILVRPLKHEYYNLEYVPAGTIYHFRRGYDTYKPFTKNEMELILGEFKENGREQLLETWR